MRFYLFYFSIFILISCQEEITLDLPQTTDKLVVEGTIEAGYPPYLILTRNQGYFETIDINTYNNLFITDVDTIKIWYIKQDGTKESRYLEKIEISDSLPPIYTDLEFFNKNNVKFILIINHY